MVPSSSRPEPRSGSRLSLTCGVESLTTCLQASGKNPPTPHRFRHTFARILLQRGVPVADVAELIGDTEEKVRRHYARWVPERQARLTNILRDAFATEPDLGFLAARTANSGMSG